MKERNTSDRLKEIMAKNGLRQIDILNKAIPFCKKYNVKLGRNDLSQYISGKVVTPKLIPKLDFSSGIPNEYATMVVIPTIVKSKEKVKEIEKAIYEKWTEEER